MCSGAGNIEKVKECWHDIRGLHECRVSLAISESVRMANNEWNMNQLFIGPGTCLSHDTVSPFAFAKRFAVIGHENDERIVEHPKFAEPVQENADPFVNQCNLACVKWPERISALLLSDILQPRRGWDG